MSCPSDCRDELDQAAGALVADAEGLVVLRSWAATLDALPGLVAGEADAISRRIDELAVELADLRRREADVRQRVARLERERVEFRCVLQRVRAGAFTRELLRREPAELVRS